MKTVIGMGAEATVTREGGEVVKERSVKPYRHPQLDTQLRTDRSRKEKRLLEKAGKHIRVPKVIFGDDTTLRMEFIEGPQLKEVLEQNISYAQTVGEYLARLHDDDIIHGDLTTSNIIVNNKEIVFIDFGLAFRSKRIEDKAVDLHLFKQVLESKHHNILIKAYRAFLKGYKQSKNAEETLKRLKAVEVRGRNKQKI